MKKLLSILIPTTSSRRKELAKLLFELQEPEYLPRTMIFDLNGVPFFGYEGLLSAIEIVVCSDKKEMSIGEKRERLYGAARGLYSWQIDDDDMIAPGAIARILKAVESGPDCITFLERCDMNGRSYLANHSIKYDAWADNKDGYDFIRTPFYKDVIRTDIARSIPFEYIRYGEDHAWSIALKPYLKTEVHLDEIVYIYQHNSKSEEHNQRYGIK